MKTRLLALCLILLSFLLQGCDGFGQMFGLNEAHPGDASSPSNRPTGSAQVEDACTNYDGVQEGALLLAQGGWQIEGGLCLLVRNHAALASHGIDLVRLAGWTGKGVSVGIVDSGYRVTHDALHPVVAQVAAYHDADNDGRLDIGEKRLGEAQSNSAAHGTAVASLLGGRGVGVAPGASLWLKATGEENPRVLDLALATLDALQNEGLRLLNHSTSLFSDILLYRQAETDSTGILLALLQSASLVIAAAGNSGLDLSELLDDVQARRPDRQSFLQNPLEARHVILVGAYDEARGEPADFSNIPGHRAELQARYLSVVSNGLEAASSGGDSLYRRVSGTSFGAPLVSGALALLLEAKPRLTPLEAAELLLRSARRPRALGYGQTCTISTALGQFSSDCGAMRYGRGLMDVQAALRLAAAR